MNTAKPQSNFKLAAKTALVQRDMSVVDLASAIGKARNSVSIAINHPTMLPGVKKLIRKHLGLKGAA